MENHAHLRPTATQRVRGFLAGAGTSPPPWASASQVMDELLSLLHARRDDAATWSSLAGLLAALRADVSRGTDGLATPEAEVLPERAIADVIAELQAALRGSPEPPGPGAAQRMMATHGGPLLACLLLLGAAEAGCTKAPEAGPPAVTQPARPDAARTAPPPDASLAQVFRDGSPEQVARKLEAMLDAAPPDASSPPDAARKKPHPRVLVPHERAVPAYKGITL